LVIIAGAGHLGATTLRRVSQQARLARQRLVLMIDHPYGDLERLAGTGGAVCIMKMYNHRDATVAAEFVGRGHRFVLSQLTEQVGTSFTDGGGDSFSASTNAGASGKPGFFTERGRRLQWSDGRGHAWTGTRNFSLAQNVGSSRSTSRVYEFTVEPEQILSMPPTAFLLVDNTGPARRVVLADCNPGIALAERVSISPAEVR
ncbi:MAG: hypothetical protein ACRDQW_15875, partial [Haloechinothrix sp.]